MTENGRSDAGRATVLSRNAVTRETLDRLDAYERLLRTWQRKTNLVAPSTLSELWLRHFEEGLILADLLPKEARSIVDLGSGGGLPGLILAIRLAERGVGRVSLVESNGKKAAFLRTVARELGIACDVHAERVENCGSLLSRADVVTARALASLNKLLAYVAPHLGRDAVCLFPKGRQHDEEIAVASQHWRFAMVKHSLRTEPGSAVLAIRGCEAVSADG